MTNRSDIEAAIPHREPFLFVDAILDQTEESIECRWTVPADADWFRGHYPGTPVTPGVIISEHVFQCAALYISACNKGFRPEDGVPVLTKIEGARYRRIVKPGETLVTRVSLRERLGPAWYMTGKTKCGEESVANLRFVLSSTENMSRALEGTAQSSTGDGA